MFLYCRTWAFPFFSRFVSVVHACGRSLWDWLSFGVTFGLCWCLIVDVQPQYILWHYTRHKTGTCIQGTHIIHACKTPEQAPPIKHTYTQNTVCTSYPYNNQTTKHKVKCPEEPKTEAQQHPLSIVCKFFFVIENEMFGDPTSLFTPYWHTKSKI